MILKVVVEKGEDGWLIAHVPELRGCRSQGRTEEELRRNIAEAIAGILDAQQDRLDLQRQAEIQLVAA